MGFVALMLGRDISLSHSFPFKRKTQNCATRTGAHRHTFTFHSTTFTQVLPSASNYQDGSPRSSGVRERCF